MLSFIFEKIGLGFVEKLIDRGAGLFESYMKKQISMEELKTQLLQVVLGSIVEIEKAQTESLTSTYNTFIKAVSQNAVMVKVWAATALSQLFVLVWHQLLIPWITILVHVWVPAWKYPSSGTTVDWAYALLALCLGGGAVALRMGPGSTSVTDQLKGLIAGARK
jgi:hypothetical protein